VVTSASTKKEDKSLPTHLFEKRRKNLRIGGDVQVKRDLTRFVKWPKYVRLQRQKRILFERLQVPPSINQFTHTLDRDRAHKVFKLLNKYKPENKKEKLQRLKEEAALKAEGKEVDPPAPLCLKYGLNHVTTLVEQRKAKLVIIAHDCDPIEMLIFLPSLCRRKRIPYCFVKGKARLGKLVHQKTAIAIAVTQVRKEDYQELNNLSQFFKGEYNWNKRIRKTGGKRMGIKHFHKMEKRR
jgi:large subunit ribosomal protein L7Ae